MPMQIWPTWVYYCMGFVIAVFRRLSSSELLLMWLRKCSVTIPAGKALLIVKSDMAE